MRSKSKPTSPDAAVLLNLGERLALHAPALVEEVHRNMRIELDAEEMRSRQLDAKATATMGVLGFVLTVAFTFGGSLMLAHADDFRSLGSWAYVLPVCFGTSLVLGVASVAFALRGFWIRTLKALNLEDLLNLDVLQKADTATPEKPSAPVDAGDAESNAPEAEPSAARDVKTTGDIATPVSETPETAEGTASEGAVAVAKYRRFIAAAAVEALVHNRGVNDAKATAVRRSQIAVMGFVFVLLPIFAVTCVAAWRAIHTAPKPAISEGTR
jgi:hypothetical protein